MLGIFSTISQQRQTRWTGVARFPVCQVTPHVIWPIGNKNIKIGVYSEGSLCCMGSVVDEIQHQNHVGNETLVPFYSRGVLVVPTKPETAHRLYHDII